MKGVMLIAICLFVFFSLGSVVLGVTLTLDAEDTENLGDLSVHETGGEQGINYGTEDAETISYSQTLGPPVRFYFKWNITDVPSDGVIESATQYFRSDSNLGWPCTPSVYEVYAWNRSTDGLATNETNMTWSNQPCGSASTIDNSTFCNLVAIDTLTLQTTYDYANVSGAINLTRNNQEFMTMIGKCTGAPSSFSLQVWYKESVLIGYDPYVTIVYHTAAPEVRNVSMIPSTIYDTSTLNCSAQYYSSVDDGRIDFIWYKNDVLQDYNGSTGLLNNSDLGYTNVTVPSPLVPNDNWTCSARAWNTTDFSAWSNSSTLLVRAIPETPTNLTESPADPATYAFGQQYDFNSTICDDNGADDISTVTLTFNVTTYTASNLSSVDNNCTVYNVTLTNLPAGVHSYQWNVTDSGGATNSATSTYSINANSSLTIDSISINDTYISFAESVNLTVVVAEQGSVVTAEIEASSGRFNVTLSGNGTEFWYVLNSTDLGNLTDNSTTVNITNVYADGNNYSLVTNSTNLNFSYGLTSLTGITDSPDPTYNSASDVITFSANYSTTEGSGISNNCTVELLGVVYNMTYSSGLYEATVSADGLATGTATYTVNCTNTNYQTQANSTNTILIQTGTSGGESPGGGGGPRATTTTTVSTNITQVEAVEELVVGDGVCSPGEEETSPDCRPSLASSTTLQLELLFIGVTILAIIYYRQRFVKEKTKGGIKRVY